MSRLGTKLFAPVVTNYNNTVSFNQMIPLNHLGVQGQITTRVALQGGALTQHTRHFVLTGIFFAPGVLSEGSPFFLRKKKKKKKR